MKKVVLYEKENVETEQGGPINYDDRLIVSDNLQEIINKLNQSLEQDINTIVDCGHLVYFDDDDEEVLLVDHDKIKSYILTVDLDKLESIIDSTQLGDTTQLVYIDWEDIGCSWTGVKEYYLLTIE